jgi:hypothetical protein
MNRLYHSTVEADQETLGCKVSRYLQGCRPNQRSHRYQSLNARRKANRAQHGKHEK